MDRINRIYKINFLNSVNHVNPVYPSLSVKTRQGLTRLNRPLAQAALTWFELQGLCLPGLAKICHDLDKLFRIFSGR